MNQKPDKGLTVPGTQYCTLCLYSSRLPLEQSAEGKFEYVLIYDG